MEIYYKINSFSQAFNFLALTRGLGAKSLSFNISSLYVLISSNLWLYSLLIFEIGFPWIST